MAAFSPVDEAGAFLAPLDALGVRYMITGSVAAMLYGEPRFTRDLDLVVALEPRDAARVHAAFDADRFDVPPVETIAEEAERARHGHFNLVDNETGFRADIYLVGDDDVGRTALAQRRRVDVGERDVWVCPPEYLIAHKLRYRKQGGGDHHVRDVRGVLLVLGERIDRALLGDLVAHYGVQAQWREVVSGEGGR